MKKRVLIVHQNFPGQFPFIAEALLGRGFEVAAIGGPTAKEQAGVRLIRWTNQRSSTPNLYYAATKAEADLIRAEAAARAAMTLRDRGFIPDLIIAHPGWGETLHLRDIFPAARQILFGELFYRYLGADVNFDPEFEVPTPEGAMRTNGKNATQALAYVMADQIISPTAFQASTFPPILRNQMRIVHEGIDLSRATRNPEARIRLSKGAILDSSTPVITFINRNFERLRGFHIFMRALPAFLDAVPEAHVIAIGADGQGYGGARPDGKTWRQAMFAELGDRFDSGRVHFVGRVEHRQMIDILSIGAAHVYYTYPFTLSWSLVEAMACECLILGSDTAPVRDAITDGVNGRLLDFFDVQALSEAMINAVRFPERYGEMRKQARRSALASFDRETIGQPGWLEIIDEVLARP